MAPKRKEVSSIYIPDDIHFSILSKLSVKSLYRFSCVRKSWNRLFGNPNFINMFRKNILSKSDENDACLILNQFAASEYNWNLYLLSGTNLQNKVKLSFPPQLNIGQNSVAFTRILGSASVNGTLCVYNWNDHTTVVLWNPATEEIKVVPHGLGRISILSKDIADFTLHGFGYDHLRDDYKLIQHVDYILFDFYDTTHRPFWEMYSLKSNSWWKLGFDMPTRCLSTDADVYMNGVCHWLGKTINGTCVVSFNLSNEVFFTTPLPYEYTPGRFDVNLVVINGSFTMISNYKKAKTFDISILGEFGVKESWVRLFDIGPLSCIEHPIGAGKDNVFFRKEDDELVYYNLTTRMIEKIGVKGEKCWCQMIIYKKNLHSIEGMNN